MITASLLALATFAAPAPEGRLFVLVVVDQLASSQWLARERLFDGGFAELARRGAVYESGVHAQANTATGPGHATIVTGAWPSEHGIVSNSWYDPQGKRVYCVDDPSYGVGPALLAAPTLADQLRISTRGRGRVVSLALKDRVSILMGGQRPALAAWWDPGSNAFVRGRHADPSLAFPALDRVNAAHAELRAKNAPWERSRPELDYAALAGPDEGAHEGLITGLGRTFPHVYGPDVSPDAYRVSPRLLEAITELATSAIDELQLGRRGETDLLLVGLTTLDYAGHYWGPESQEALDVLLRTDRALGRLIAHAEAKLGRGKVGWALTGDHGVTPTPDVAKSSGARAERADGKAIVAKIDAALAPLAAKGKPPTTVSFFDPPLVWLSHADPTAERAPLRRAAAKALAADPAILEAHAVDDVAAFSGRYRVMFERTVFPGREPDVLFLGRPNDLIDLDYHTGTGHGSPYVYDTHVPIVLAGPGVKPKRTSAPVEVTRLAPTIAASLGILPPAAALDPPLD